MASQDPFLFDATVRENLYLPPNATNHDIWNALEMVAKDFVKGYLTRKYHDWRTWNQAKYGGEAKAYAKEHAESSTHLVLDEATASVDVETERFIQKALDNLIIGRTTLIIAHRLSTIRNADQILFLENGSLIERGNHSQLINLNGKYSRFCKYQENLVEA